MESLLEVAGLCVSYGTAQAERSKALSEVSFAVSRGETLGVLGESGSGKSTLAAALLRLLPPNGRIDQGVVRFEGEDLLRAEAGQLRRIRGGRIGSVFQEPRIALHPAIRVGEQVADVLAAHQAMDRRSLQEKTREVLKTVFPEDAERLAECYPHQLSGGQRARVLVAQAMICEPSLIIADEPTASLDAVTQSEVLSLFRSLRVHHALAMIFITHNPLLLAGFADGVLVLYGGNVVEIGLTNEVLSMPRHPYTRDLLRCVPPFPPMDPAASKGKLPVLRENSASPAVVKTRCAFEGRCSDRLDICTTRAPVPVALSDVHKVSCFKYGS